MNRSSNASQRTFSRAVLGALGLWLLVMAATAERRDWTSFMGDEATYLMQAESLAWDGDLLYEAADYHRFVANWKLPPQGLILQSGDGGASITFGKPVFYATYLAPFVRLLGNRGPFIANALLLLLTAAVVAGPLERRLGPWACLWLATLLFATVVFATVFWIHADPFLMCATAVALALTLGHSGTLWHSGRWIILRHLAVGFLVALVVFSRPPYLPLLFAVLWLLPVPRCRSFGAALIGVALLLSGAGAMHQEMTGSWTPYGAQRSGFYQHTGYPGIDFPAEDWQRSVAQHGNAAARTPLQTLQDRGLPVALIVWNSFYFLVGRHVGILIYFLPLILLLRPAGRRALRQGRGRPAALPLVLCVAVAVAFFLWSRPFNFYGGGGTLANRYFLPLFPLLWFVPRRRLGGLEVTAVGLLAGLFMWPLWQAPRQFPITEQGTYRYVSTTAQSLLPFETTQSHLRLAGREDHYDGFFLRLTSPQTKLGRDGRFRLEAGEASEMLLGSTLPLPHVELQIYSAADLPIEIEGGRLEIIDPAPDHPDRPDAPRRALIYLDDPIARHPMWWTWDRAHLYRLQLRFGTTGQGRTVFRLVLPTTPPAKI